MLLREVFHVGSQPVRKGTRSVLRQFDFAPIILEYTQLTLVCLFICGKWKSAMGNTPVWVRAFVCETQKSVTTCALECNRCRAQKLPPNDVPLSRFERSEVSAREIHFGKP